MFLKTLQQRIVDKREHGENIEKDINKFVLLSKWIQILQDYYDSIENDVLPSDHNLDEEDVFELMAKISKIIDVKQTLNNVWLVQSGHWNDESAWDDDFIWSDTVTFS